MSMLFRTLSALLISTTLAATSLAATQSQVTPFEAMRTQLVLKPGQTYLSFMASQVKPALDSYEQAIQNAPATLNHNYRQLQSDLIGQGAGVAIRIDANNYLFNIGYLNGSDPQNDIKSGRSYGVGPFHKQSDPSDVYYLRELEAYLHQEPGSVGNFVATLMLVLTNCDTSGWSHLSPMGQTVATDFLAIYTAELDRHLMVNLNPKTHPWEIDLAAATLVSIFSTSSGLIMQNGQLVQGRLENWWAQGTQGSGIGETRRDRIALQRLIAREESGSPEAQQLLSILNHRPDGDVIQGLLEYLNSPIPPRSFNDGQVQTLTSLTANYLLHVQAHSGAIASLR